DGSGAVHRLETDELHAVYAVEAALQRDVALQTDELVGAVPDLGGVADLDDLVDLVAALDMDLLPLLPAEEHVALAVVVRGRRLGDPLALVGGHDRESAVAAVDLGDATRGTDRDGRQLVEHVLLNARDRVLHLGLRLAVA